MKNIVRIAAIALVAAGAFVGNSQASKSVASHTVAMHSAAPVPTCPPNDPNGCGIGYL
jgi:hypothetical protein